MKEEVIEPAYEDNLKHLRLVTSIKNNQYRIKVWKRIEEGSKEKVLVKIISIYPTGDVRIKVNNIKPDEKVPEYQEETSYK